MSGRKRIAVIGAGIAGITLANALHSSAEVVVFEKSRGTGGRMATRRRDGWRFNLGAQFFTVRSEALEQLLPEFSGRGLVEPWQAKIVTLSPVRRTFKRLWHEAHYRGLPGMNAVVRHMAEDLDVRLQTPVAGINRHRNAWLLQGDEGEQLGYFDLVVTTAPAPQSAELLPAEFSGHEQLKAVEFTPCFALMLAYRKPLKLTFSAAVVRDSPLAWLAVDRHSDTTGPGTTLLAHSSNEWAAENLAMPMHRVGKVLFEALQDLCGAQCSRPDHFDLHQWRYARVESALDIDYLFDADRGLAACGDWCRGSRVEDAFLSGLALAHRVGETLGDH